MILPDKKPLFYLSWFTLIGMSVLGVLLIIYIQKKDVRIVLLGDAPYYVQLVSGLSFGVLSSLLSLLLVNSRWLKNVRVFFADLLHGINPSFMNILFYSACAGIGEEILFRAGIQPIIGIWPAAVLFVFLHGYLNPYNISLAIYGIFLIIICSGFGYLFKFFGLASSITAHFVYDVSMFSILKYSYRDK